MGILKHRAKAKYPNLDSELEFKRELLRLTHIYRVLESTFSAAQYAWLGFEFVTGFYWNDNCIPYIFYHKSLQSINEINSRT